MSGMKTNQREAPAATTIQAGELVRFVTKLAEKSGVGHDEAKIFADSLVDANLNGIDTHGVSRVPIYLKRVSLGLINPKAKMIFKRDSPAVGVLDAENGLGQVAGMRAMDEAVKMARECGAGVVGVRNSQHFGAAGYYCSMAAREGLVGMAFTNAEPALPPWGSYEAYFGTNPIAIAVPTGSDIPIIIDTSTSVVARGKIVAAARTGTPIPSEWALDPEGNPTTDPQKALEGAVLTMAGPKGYALAMMVDILSGVITGSGFGRGVNSMYKDLEHRANVGHMLIALNVDAFMPKDVFLKRVQSMVGDVKSSKKRPGVNEISIPGERKDRVRQKRMKNGIVLDASVVTELASLAYELDVASPFGVAPQRITSK